jgi:hypothetical protein
VLPAIDPRNPPSQGEGRFVLEYMQNRPDRTSRCLTTWAAETPDLDADGRLELFLVNGAVGHRYEADVMPDQLYWRPPGQRAFREVGASAGLSDTGRGRTAVFADMNGDGLLDAVLGNAQFGGPMDTPGAIFRNRSRDVGHSLQVTLRGPGANRNGVGAVVEVLAGGTRQVKLRTFGTSFLSSSAAPLHFGIGAATKVDRVTVHWPWGLGNDAVRDVPADGTVQLEYGTGR